MKNHLFVLMFFSLLTTCTTTAQEDIDELMKDAAATTTFEERMEYLDQAIKVNPKSPKPYVHRGLAYVRFKLRFDLAIEEYSKAIALDPNCIEAYYFRSVAYAGDEPEKSKADFEQAKRLEAILDKSAAKQKREPTKQQRKPIIEKKETKPSGSSPIIEFDQTQLDFGVINEGEKVERTYTYTNTGNKPLIISHAKGSCACTVPRWPKAPLAPGASAELTVEFNSKNKKGKRNQKVTLMTNAQPEQHYIYLKGEVIPMDDDLKPSGN